MYVYGGLLCKIINEDIIVMLMLTVMTVCGCSSSRYHPRLQQLCHPPAVQRSVPQLADRGDVHSQCPRPPRLPAPAPALCRVPVVSQSPPLSLVCLPLLAVHPLSLCWLFTHCPSAGCSPTVPLLAVHPLSLCWLFTHCPSAGCSPHCPFAVPLLAVQPLSLC